MKKDNLIHDIVNIEIDKSKILNDILNYKGFKSKKKFAEFLGINPNTLSNWYSRNTFDENLIIGKIPELNEVWLLTGKGEMLKPSEETPIKGEGVKVILDAEIKRTPSEGTPYYDVDFAGGWNSDEIFSLGNPSFYIQSPDFRRAEFATNLVGNSVSKVIPSGAIIGLRQIEDWKTYFPTNELYGIITKNEMRTVKRVKRKKGDPNTLVLIPDPLEVHSGYEPEELPIDFVSKMFQVVAWAMFERVAM
ncbi:helix-turn-helix domain containing protein [Riemerella anatipestifer]|uniref:Helix-turn-helix domain containing protein n=1 Tax=Riemerella anatipestifer TaxID=34085 RepID=A0AAP3AK37_RIEAN|nr:helix-turn-helix domain-containing protein [Riemerella anatipestifer]MBT0572463.1 helix-turn-helix domain-containing protein [Riemerella anatipestifer]MCW0489600.1 helix-turn-helix domain containing protein [Riemerella anatipestifer]MCW0523205.1 helix-turn-helix domain containing protein [Riemerella anatipestifer]MDR7796135.1 helix-turn-helix domain-containing protein [Riemerella anatipestifer]MDY3432476.1 helix-turn-helix domain-containing protein [Riemerella anatipestifer]